MDKVSTSTTNLRELVKEHSSMGEAILKAAGGNLYPMDLLAIAVLNRSVSLLVGFCDLIEKRNFVSAAPLLRLQLDNLLRFQGAWLVKEPHDFSMNMLRGERVRDMKDRDGNKMTDRYLLEKMAVEYPVLKRVYEHTSGYIHLSEKHFYNSMTSGKQNGGWNIKVAPVDSYLPEIIYLEALRAFFEVTGILFRYIQGWVVAKSGPTN